jgi:hypothetical protein
MLEKRSRPCNQNIESDFASRIRRQNLFPVNASGTTLAMVTPAFLGHSGQDLIALRITDCDPKRSTVRPVNAIRLCKGVT